MSSETPAPPLSQQRSLPKFLRYRSVRHDSRPNPRTSPPPPFQTATDGKDTTLSRSPSRYHRRLKSVDTAAGTAEKHHRPPIPLRSHSASLADLNGETYPVAAKQSISNDGAQPVVATQNTSIIKSGQHVSPGGQDASAKINQSSLSLNASDSTPSQFALADNGTNEDARAKLRVEEERISRIKAKQNAAREFERLKGLASANKAPLRNLQNSEKGVGNAHTSTSPARGSKLTKARKPRWVTAREEKKPASPKTIGDPPCDSSEVGDLRNGQSLNSEGRPLPRNQQLNLPAEAQPKMPDPSKTAGPVPPTSDIPRSAVNAGERRVVVKYNESVISLPVTPTTTPRDLLNSASQSMSSPLDSQKSVLSESFTQLGLERPLRSYEHIRDIMNSWDYDTQNHLFVMPKSTMILSPGDLDPKALPKQPSGTSLYMYHSQRPGKWDKRWVSLKEDGQISVSKREDGSESTNVCHLSDFDIYKPTQRQMKKLRPPKKICFAIKSQQKAAIFLDGTSFVHFFATSDGPLTETWYSVVRTWRSWYLVNMLGEGQVRETHQRLRGQSSLGPHTMAHGSSSQIQLPSPKRGPQPKPDWPKDFPPNDASSGFSPPKTRQKQSRGRNAPPSSFPKFMMQHPDPVVPSSASKRAPSVVKGGGSTASVRSNAEAPSSHGRSTSLSRAGSIRQGHKPLVDLTPQFQEQPQHIRKGRGVAPIPGKPLVDLATDLEALPGAINIPPARAWQRPPVRDPGVTAGGAPIAKVSSVSTELSSHNLPFTGTGLLSRSKSKRAQGGIGHGFGVKTGHRDQVGKPLLDLKIQSRFADGSLLRQVETFQGEDERGLIVDRTKRTEQDVSVGEGV